METVNSVIIYLMKFDYKELPEQFKLMYSKLMEYAYTAIGNILDLYKSGNINKMPLTLDNFIQTFMKLIFNICLNDNSSKDPLVWGRVKQLYRNFKESGVLIKAWKIRLEELTNTLTKQLKEISKETFDIFCDPQVLPFEGLPMRKEYVLQVLYDAFSCTDTKYAKVRLTQIYSCTFEFWMQFLSIIQFPKDFDNKVILADYFESKVKYKYSNGYDSVSVSIR